MSVSTTAEVSPKAKAPVAKAAPPKAKAPVEQAIPASVEIGDIVIFSPPLGSVAAMQSATGSRVTEWPAIVTFVFPDRLRAALRCIRPFATNDVVVRDARYDADGAQGTFRTKAPKVVPGN